MHVRTMPIVNFKKTKKTLATKNNQDYDSLHQQQNTRCTIFNKQSATKTPAQHLLCVSQDLREAQLTMAKP